MAQQDSDTGGVDVPDLVIPQVVQPAPQLPVQPLQGQPPPAAGADRRANQCSHPLCVFDRAHAGVHSHELDDAGAPRRPGLTLRDRTRAGRDVANVLAAVEGVHGKLFCAAASDRHAFPVAAAGDGANEILVCYNVDAPTLASPTDPPKNTKEALNGPHAAEWHDAYRLDLEAKMHNETFVYVPRPTDGTKVIKTTVNHVHKHADRSNPLAITMRRARWVGAGYMQNSTQFNATYCATPTACSCRVFCCMIVALSMETASADVVKAFTLSPIDIPLLVEQMPGMETAGDWRGATKENTVCLLKKCLEGLKQSGNVWQRNHNEFLDGLNLTKHHCVIRQSPVEPCLFIGHCALGIIALLVWVDDIFIGFTKRSLYDEFRSLYKARFPSEHSLGCTQFAGLHIDHDRANHRIAIHQRPHIELAYDKFVVDKVAAAKSPAIHRPAVYDRNSARHYSKLGLAANDRERSEMRDKPFLPALATLMYIVFFTGPHLVFYTSFLGQFMHDPSPACYDAIIDLIIFTYHHRHDSSIVYGGPPTIPKAVPQRRRQDFLDSFGFYGTCDASWLLRSPAGHYIFFLFGPIDWASKLIRVICHSSSEAEIAAGCITGKRMVFISQLIADFKVVGRQCYDTSTDTVLE